MSEKDTSVKKVSWWQGIKSEFKKIIWPDKKTLVRETIAVFVTTVILGLVIVLIDYVVQLGLDHIIR
ncbi:MAG: preprotein translocase subunit SecE [Lachnospiraceae bacterium]|nr:preprotein translocase subunit SecE [Lachnospiraceae bacterium]MBR6274133.1 preprotein translocase subunit SecE [Lachnospiraceae bacterium]